MISHSAPLPFDGLSKSKVRTLNDISKIFIINMKIVINESRLDDMTIQYFMNEIGEYEKTPKSNDQLGYFHKGVKRTAKIIKSETGEIYLIFTNESSDIIKTIISLFSVSKSYLSYLISDKLSPIVGVQYIIPIL